MENKVRSLDALSEVLESHRAQGNKIVQCHGVFDLLHIGHIRYFNQAKKMGDLLVVTLTPDRFVDKGPHRPAFKQDLRAEAIASLDCVDFVAINEWPTAEETLRKLRPDVYVKGSEFKNLEDRTGKIGLEAAVVEEIGAELAFTEDITFSSTTLINKFLADYPKELKEYMDLFRSRYKLEEILDIIDAMSQLRVLVIGDTIIDEYQYCAAIGKSSKDPTLAVHHKSESVFTGGVLAVANHVANFAKEVTIATVIGEKDSHLELIKRNLPENGRLHYEEQAGAPTTVKRRIIDGYSFNKLLEIYVMDDSGLALRQDVKFCEWIKQAAPEYDLTIVSDFGHGAISARAARAIVNNSPFIAVNTQANAGNRGFNTISKYERANFPCIAAHEMRLETRNKSSEITVLVPEVAKKMKSDFFVVTLGREGCAVWSEPSWTVIVPPFAKNVVDRVGAGDAFFSIASLAAKLNVPAEVLGFIGNVFGALAVKVVGNEKSITRQSVEKFVTALMK